MPGTSLADLLVPAVVLLAASFLVDPTDAQNCTVQATHAACQSMYVNTATECGWSSFTETCYTCNNRTADGETVCAASDGGSKSPCAWRRATASCVSSGFPCTSFNALAGCTSQDGRNQLDRCVWDDTGACVQCASYASTECPTPICGILASSCVSPSSQCAAYVSQDTCTAAGINCFWKSATDGCLWCGDIPSSSACNAESACAWNPITSTGQALCVAYDATTAASSSSSSSTIAIAVGAAAGSVTVLALVGVVVWRYRANRYHSAAVDPEVNADDNKLPEIILTTKAATGSSEQLDSTKGSQLRSASRNDLTPRSSSTASSLSSSAIAAIPALYREGRIQRVKMIGRGASGTVFSCVHPDGCLIAVKEMFLAPGFDGSSSRSASTNGNQRLSSSDANGGASSEEAAATASSRDHPTSTKGSIVDTVLHEVNLIASIDHPNIVRYYGHVLEREAQRLTLFMELLPNGSLGSLVRSMDAPMQEGVGRAYVRQLTTALAYLHQRGIVHRDVKCDNVLIAQDGHVKLSDFGASKAVGTNTTNEGRGGGGGPSRGAMTMIGTPCYMAPEILMPAEGQDVMEGYGRRADVWSLGITVLEMLECGNAPWPSSLTTAGAIFMHLANPATLPLIPDRLSGDAKDFVLQCCQRDPQQRPTCEALLQHPWLQQCDQ